MCEKLSDDEQNSKSNFFEIIGIIAIVLLLYWGVYKYSTYVVFEEVSSILIDVKKPVDFYNTAYSNLVSTAWALFTSLVTVAVALFGIQKWFENKKYEEIQREIKRFIKKQEKDIPNQIRQTINEKKGEISETLKELLNELVRAESKKEEVNFVQSLINTHLSYLLDEEKKFFCKEQFKHIVEKMNLNFSENTIDPFLAYHQLLEDLIDQIKKDPKILANDIDFKTAILKIISHLDYVESTDNILFQVHSLDVFKEKMLSLL